MRLTDEQLAELKAIIDEHEVSGDDPDCPTCCYCGQDYELAGRDDVGFCWTCASEKLGTVIAHLPAMLDEIESARKVVEAATVLADAIKSSAYVKPGTKHAALIAAVRAYHQQRPIPPAGSHATVFESD